MLLTRISNVIRCPYCGESYYEEMYSEMTTAYYPPIYKDEVNINPDRNTTTTKYLCNKCGEIFKVVNGEVEK